MNRVDELKQLIAFFALPQSEQRSKVPNSMPRIWVRAGYDIEADTNEPIKMLALTFYGSLYSIKGNGFGETLLELLIDIRSVLDWIIECVDYAYAGTSIFATDNDLDDLSNRMRIWRVLARLCQSALKFDEFKKLSDTNFSFDYYSAKYALMPL